LAFYKKFIDKFGTEAKILNRKSNNVSPSFTRARRMQRSDGENNFFINQAILMNRDLTREEIRILFEFVDKSGWGVEWKDFEK